MKSTIPQNKEQVKNNLVRVLPTLPSHKSKAVPLGRFFYFFLSIVKEEVLSIL